jgi:phosphoribosyl-AMP cyclohydrolase
VTSADAWLDEVRWDERGLATCIAQELGTGRILMVAWTSREALARTRELAQAVYFSRSRGRLWHKGEQSGHTQRVRSIRLDCDGDVVVLEVEQAGGIACHTGHASCFFRRLDGDRWVEVEPVLKDPREIYDT